MAGIKNDVVYGLNADFSRAGVQTGSESNGLVTDGELWIGSTTTNVGGTHVNVGNLVSPNNSITFGFSSPNITASVNTAVVHDLHTARFIVSAGGLTDGANYTTIQSAYNAAISAGGNQTVFIQPGTYTENITLSAGINLCAYNCDATTPNVTIIGKCTLTAAGTVSISGIRLQTNSDFALAVTGTLASSVNLQNCFLNCTNNTGISLTSSSASAKIELYNCNGDLGTTGIAYFSANSAGQIIFVSGRWQNSGNSTTANTFASTGFLLMSYLSNFLSPISISDTVQTNIYYCRINTSNTTSFTSTSSATSGFALYSRFDGGTASAISIGAGTFTVDCCDVVSSNANAITGAGTLQFGKIVFTGTSSTVNVTTQTALVTQPREDFTTTSFTPVLNFGGATTGITYSTQSGLYSVQGNVVIFNINIALSNKGSAVGAATITGFPLTSVATNPGAGPISNWGNITLTAGFTTTSFIMNGSATSCALFQNGSASAVTALADTHFANTSSIRLNGFYFRA
jgi:hypothetical protein